jgi:hypothetical protein
LLINGFKERAVTVELRGSTGLVQYRTALVPTNDTEELNLSGSDISPGLYLVTLRAGDESESMRLLVTD